MLTAAMIILYVLVLPYLGLLFLVNTGMFLPDRQRRRTGPLPSVTVIIPAHNEEERLGGTLASLSEQRYAGALEFVIVDDRSTDATRDIIDRFAARDPRFRRVTVTRPSGRLSPKVNAVNTGIRASDGDVIITSDADCEYPAGWVAELVDHFGSGVVMVVGYLETTRKGEARSNLERFETIDWLSLMLTSRSLTRYGWMLTS
ncbi:MAG TPA: glycosyltransferase, partial [Deinococcales bacterium]|nr:glycosyltransferase [Deinococcales bacterium]